MAKVRKGESASTAANPANLVKAGKPRPENQGRPHVGLYHEVFAHFRAKFRDTSLEIPPDVYAAVTKLFEKAQLVYSQERFRESAIKPVLVELMGDTYSSTRGPRAEPDGVMSSMEPGRPTAYRAFLEFKNEIGTGGCDPCSQGFIAYEKFWSDETVRPIDLASSFEAYHDHSGRPYSRIFLLPELHNRYRWSIDSRSRRCVHR